MSEPIKVGDLVMVVRPFLCCGFVSKSTGLIFKVSELFSVGAHGLCNKCGKQPPNYSSVEAMGSRFGGIQLSRLKRIPPLSELEGERTEETLKLPTKEPA